MVAGNTGAITSASIRDFKLGIPPVARSAEQDAETSTWQGFYVDFPAIIGEEET